jgi:hypothetical protein
MLIIERMMAGPVKVEQQDKINWRERKVGWKWIGRHGRSQDVLQERMIELPIQQ